MNTMKRIYLTPATELIELELAGVMVPDQQSGPGFGNKANYYTFDDEEGGEEEKVWDEIDNNGLDNSFSN